MLIKNFYVPGLSLVFSISKIWQISKHNLLSSVRYNIEKGDGQKQVNKCQIPNWDQCYVGNKQMTGCVLLKLYAFYMFLTVLS